MVDPNLSSSISLLHMPASRPEIDGAPGGSINDSVWAKVVQKNYNDMENSKPPFRFPDDPELGPFNPNDASISARGADNMKSQWASLRSEFTVCYARWGFSGQNDPETFPNFCQGRAMLIYMFRIMGGDKEIMGQTLRFLPESSSLSSDDLDVAGLCDAIITNTSGSNGNTEVNDEGEQQNITVTEEEADGSSGRQATPGTQTKTPRQRGRPRKKCNSSSTASMSSVSSIGASESIVKALQDFGDIAKKQSEAFVMQSQVAEQQRQFAVEQSRAAIERDSVAALRELFLLQKEVETTISAASNETDSNLPIDEQNRKRKAFQTNIELSELLNRMSREK
jgi:hypothetical protein